MHRFGICLVAAAAACYAPKVQDNVPCSLDGSCPNGQMCIQNMCRSTPLPIDAANELIDAPDTLPDDASVIDAKPQPIDAKVTAPDAPVDGPAVVGPNALGGQRWLMPCTSPGTATLCNCATSMQTVQLTGSPSQTYSVTLRIRGIMEIAPYTGGTPAPTGDLYTGGMVNDAFHNIYEITVSSPSQHYFINSGATASGVSAVDYQITIPIGAAALVQFSADGQDGKEGTNYDATTMMPITIPGVTTNPQPYDGQFAQVDVITAI